MAHDGDLADGSVELLKRERVIVPPEPQVRLWSVATIHLIKIEEKRNLVNITE
jgi:hypothetical protein